MNKVKWCFGVVNALSLMLVFLWCAVTMPATDMNFFSREFDKYGIPQSIAVEKSDLMNVTEHLTDYMMGKREDLVVNATINGEWREFFNQREKDHMVDVRNLFIGGQSLVYTGVMLFFVTCSLIFFFDKNIKSAFRVLAKSYAVVFSAFLAIVAVVAGFMALNFNRAFTIFHEIFFTNDLWILDPATDLLVNIVPQPFFVDIAVMIACLFVGQMLLFIILSVVASKTFLSNKK